MSQRPQTNYDKLYIFDLNSVFLLQTSWVIIKMYLGITTLQGYIYISYKFLKLDLHTVFTYLVYIYMVCRLNVFLHFELLDSDP